MPRSADSMRQARRCSRHTNTAAPISHAIGPAPTMTTDMDVLPPPNGSVAPRCAVLVLPLLPDQEKLLRPLALLNDAAGSAASAAARCCSTCASAGRYASSLVKTASRRPPAAH